MGAAAALASTGWQGSVSVGAIAGGVGGKPVGAKAEEGECVVVGWEAATSRAVGRACKQAACRSTAPAPQGGGGSHEGAMYSWQAAQAQ